MLVRIENSCYSNNTYHSCPENNGKRWTKWKDVETSFYEKQKQKNAKKTFYIYKSSLFRTVAAPSHAWRHRCRWCSVWSLRVGETLWLTGAGDSFAWFLARPTYLSADLCFTAIQSSIFFFFSPAMHSELAERNSTKTGHILGSRCDLNKRLCYCRGTARRATSVEILWPFFDWAIDKKLC